MKFTSGGMLSKIDVVTSVKTSIFYSWVKLNKPTTNPCKYTHIRPIIFAGNLPNFSKHFPFNLGKETKNKSAKTLVDTPKQIVSPITLIKLVDCAWLIGYHCVIVMPSIILYLPKIIKKMQLKKGCKKLL